MLKRYLAIGVALVIAVLTFVSCAMQDKIVISHVISHDRTFVYTDPSKGYNTFSEWAIFPNDETSYRRVVLNITYACPDSLHCGEWDYIDGVYLRRIGGQGADSTNIEIARLISPYGWRFDSTWSFDWHVDVTDFAPLLHDSVEVEFRHTGYESNDDRGWLITLDFEVTEGKPAVEILGMDTLWCGSFPFGDSARPIEELLHPIEFDTDSATLVRLRIHQTGHGMDDAENCAEFCDKYRRTYFDDSLINERQIWRECGDNPLYPQAGTWIFDRANWCPGSVVYPDVYDFSTSPSSHHTVNIDMEPYINPNNPTANYWIYSYLFYCKEPWATNDVSLEDIAVPSKDDEYSRYNPSCSNPRALVKNSGRAPLTSLDLEYGVSGRSTQSFLWNGTIAPQKSEYIDLPGVIDAGGKMRFDVTLKSPNGNEDEYPADNSRAADLDLPPVLGPRLILNVHTNKEPDHNSYKLVTGGGETIIDRPHGSLVADTTYIDTLNLSSGCYQFVFEDTAGDGLDFWFNPEGGYGYVRLLDFDQKLIKDFNPDFGNGVNYSFRVDESLTSNPLSEEVPIMRLFPPRNEGIVGVDLFLNDAAAISLLVESDSLGVVYSTKLESIKQGMPQIDIQDQPDGVYHVKAIIVADTLSRRMQIKH